MEQMLGFLLIVLVVIVILFYFSRALILWYLRINDAILNQQKTNLILEIIAAKLGAQNSDKLTIEGISTKKKKDEWLTLKSRAGNEQRFRIVAEDAEQ